MAEQAEVDWGTCERAGCIGICIDSAPVCLAHASEHERAAALERVGQTGDIDARGVSITPELLEQILAAAPRDPNGKDDEPELFGSWSAAAWRRDDTPLINNCRFHRATFTGDTDFSNVIFAGEARFSEAIFTADAVFSGVTFTDRAYFNKVAFSGDAEFGDAKFKDDAAFHHSTFSGGLTSFRAATFSFVWFDQATFSGLTLFQGTRFGSLSCEGATFAGDVQFIRARFTGAQFTGTTFAGHAGFGRATFKNLAEFRQANFSDSAWFGGVTFEDGARFGQAIFKGPPGFGGTIFKSDVGFEEATFTDRADFEEATFTGRADFEGATFTGDAQFDRATFAGDVRFGRACFCAGAGFAGTSFKRRAEFNGARFEQARQFGPILAYRGLVLDDVQFEQPVQIEVSSTGICCRRARFPGGVQFLLRWARVILDDTDLAAPSILTGVPRLSSDELTRREERIARAWQRLLAGKISERPQLLSLCRANVAGLGLSNVSAADCHFTGTHNLDKLRLESGVVFATAPLPVGPGGQKQGGREVIAEERMRRAKPSGRWVAPEWPDWLDEPQPRPLAPGQIAGLYRALRKGREDVKDEPGAADFYYGEMEMRRARPVSGGFPAGQSAATSRGRMERGILTAYWLVSGYGLRAWRAVAALVMVTALFAVAFHLIGFAVPPRPVSYWTSLLYAFRATLSLTDDEVKLTAWGKLLQGVLRLTGPVLLGLALLALRNRVKR